MNLGFDLDEVISKTAIMAIESLNDYFEYIYTVDDLKSFHFSENKFSDVKGIQDAIVEYLIWTVTSPEMLNSAEPYEDSVKALNLLKHQGHKIFIVTKRPYNNFDATIDWLHKHDVPFDKLVLTNEESKGYAAKKYNLDCFVDDLESNLIDLYESKSRWKKGLMLMTRPWNKDNYIDGSKFIRVNNWVDVIKNIDIGNRLKGQPLNIQK